MTYPVGPVRGGLAVDGNLNGRLSSEGSLSGALSTSTGGAGPPYEGPYEVTPTREMQTLSTAGMSCYRNIVVNPIPPEYGLVSYDGSVLTIS